MGAGTFLLDETATKINEMKTEYLKNLLATFGENIKFDYNLKKEHGLISEGKQKFFIKQKV